LHACRSTLEDPHLALTLLDEQRNFSQGALGLFQFGLQIYGGRGGLFGGSRRF
jgi:hypothetical protein